MAERRRGDSRALPRDQQVRREVLDEITSETVEEGSGPQHRNAYRNPNRDQSRGDWDRSRRHTDEGKSRGE